MQCSALDISQSVTFFTVTSLFYLHIFSLQGDIKRERTIILSYKRWLFVIDHELWFFSFLESYKLNIKWLGTFRCQHILLFIAISKLKFCALKCKTLFAPSFCSSTEIYAIYLGQICIIFETNLHFISYKFKINIYKIGAGTVPILGAILVVASEQHQHKSIKSTIFNT